jgi:hypothetical protein
MLNPEPKAAETNGNDLDLPRWAVISFARCEAASLTYRQAAEKLAELESQRITGLCIVSNDVANRLGR